MQSLEIDARRCKPHKAARLKTVHADRKSKRSEKLRLRKIGIGSSFGSRRSRVRKAQAGRTERWKERKFWKPTRKRAQPCGIGRSKDVEK